jgi:hypothetical protein
MGRKKLNRTEEQLREQKRIRDKRYYERHGERIKQKRMLKYWKTMEEKLS